jgi:hypothetical protein
MEALESVIDDIDDERQGRARWVYKLHQLVRWMPLGSPEREATINRVGSRRNIAADRIAHYLEVPERLPYHLLAKAFPGPGGECAWHVGLTWSHLEKAAAAGGDRYTPEQRVEWLTRAADNEMSLAQFTDWLRQTGVIRTPKRGDRFTPEDGAREAEVLVNLQAAAALINSAVAGDRGGRVKAKALRFLSKNEGALKAEAPIPDTAITLLEAVADDARRRGIDVPLMALPEPGKAYSISKTLRKMAERFDHERPGAEFTIGSPVQGEEKNRP